MKNNFILLCLAALLWPRAALAYPDSRASFSVQAAGSSWTVLRDNKDAIVWYYLPATAIVRTDKTRQPELALMKMQVPAEGDKIQEAAVLLVALNLQPSPEVKAELARAVADLAPMKELKAAPANVKLACVTLHDARLTLLDAEGKTVAEGGADPSVSPVFDPLDVSFTVTAKGEAAQRLSELLLGKDGLGLSVAYSYTAGPAPAAASGKASGRAGLADYPKETADKAVMVLPPGQPEYAFFKLPQADAGQDLISIAYNVTMLDDKGKQLAGMQAQAMQWRPGEGWRDPRGNSRRLLLFPLKPVYTSGLKLAALKYKIDASLTWKGKTEKAAAVVPALTNDLPLAAQATPFRTVRISADYLAFGGEDDILAVTATLKCGKEQESAVFKSKEGGPVTAPATVFFTKDCGNISVTANYILGNHERKSTVINVENGKGLVFLENLKD